MTMRPMTIGKDRLERLQIASPCETPWEAMRGEGRRRHCAQCDRHVYDLARLTPREIGRLLEATGGRLCARMTRDGFGRLVVLEPPAAAGPPPPALRRASSLAAAVVASFAGLASLAVRPLSAAPADAAAAVSPAVEPPAADGRENLPGNLSDDLPENRLEPAAGGVLAGTLANAAGEPIPDAEIRLQGRLDGLQRAGRTDAAGRFSFASLTAGIYDLAASVRGYGAASEPQILLRAGESRQVGLTVPAEVWRRIVDGEPEAIALGGAVAMSQEPMRRAYEEARLVVLGVARKSVVLERRDEYTWEVRTDLVISAVHKGTTGERVISLFHEQMPEEGGASRLQPGDQVLAFVNPRQAEDGRPLDGYVAVDPVRGLQKLSAAELEGYRSRLQALARMSRDGAAQPADILAWLVATTEDPVTRGEAVGELSQAVGQLERQALDHRMPVGAYAQALQGVLADFVAAGGAADTAAAPELVAAFLTDAERERLTSALLATPHLETADLELYELVSSWHEDRLLPWMIGRLESPDLADGEGRRAMEEVAGVLGDEGLAKLLDTPDEERPALPDARTDPAAAIAAAERQEREEAAAAASLRQRFLAALRRRER